jgi:hypothetical protein
MPSYKQQNERKSILAAANSGIFCSVCDVTRAGFPQATFSAAVTGPKHIPVLGFAAIC